MDHHAAVDPLQHVVKRESSHRDGGECFHFHTGPGVDPNLGLDPDTATQLTAQFLADQEGAVRAVRRETANLVTRYSFDRGDLRGLSENARESRAGTPAPIDSRASSDIPVSDITVAGS